MATNHDDLIQNELNLSPTPVPFQGFGAVALFVEDNLAGDLATLIGTYKVYKTDAAVAADSTELGAAAVTTLTSMLNQLRTPEQGVVVVPVGNAADTAAYDTAWDALANSDADFWAVTVLDPSNSAGILALSAKVETSDLRSAMFFLQDDDAAWYTTTSPLAASGALEPVADYERVAVYYDEDDTNPSAASWASYRLAFDIDQTTPAWTGELKSVDPSTTTLTQDQKNQVMANNANIGLPFYGASVRVAAGVTIQGRTINEILTADWIDARISERWATYVLAEDRAGRQIPLNTEGQAKLRAQCVTPVLEEAFATGKIEGDFEVKLPALTATDIAQLRLTSEVFYTPIKSAVRYKSSLNARIVE